MMHRFRRNNSSQQQTQQSQTQPPKKRNLFRRGGSSESLPHNSSNNSTPPLAQFDACIEACDALAASSTRQTSAHLVTSDDDCKDTNNDKVESIPDCSVLVSPDGALLFTKNIHSDEPYGWTKRDKLDYPTIGHEEEYASAVVTGNDLTSGGDYDSNGFSGRGWDADAASVALKASQGVLHCIEEFVEGVALCEKEKGAVVVNSCGKYSHALEKVRLEYTPGEDLGRVGPLLADGSSLMNALMEMEEYYSSCAESSSERWREACCDEYHRGPSSSSLHHRDSFDGQVNGNNDIGQSVSSNKTIDESLIQGVIPRIKVAAKKAEERTYERELALTEVRSKVAEAQDNLMKQKEWSASHWQRVKEENKRIDQIVNQQVKEQNELMQRLREEKEAARLEQSMHENALSEHDLWEMVKDVGAMEEFEHTGYSPRSPHKVPMLINGNANSNHDSATAPENDLDLPHVPNISRAAIEKESDIHELRRAALDADDLVEDAAGGVLNVMSKLDTTTRSARVAAESNLLSECNAAHQCLRSIVEIERAALRERMERLQKLEAAVDAVNVRKDIDNYIQRDKTLPGGLSRGGDNDDGGVAAALAVLNSHTDDCFDPSKTNITRPNFFKGWSDAGEDEDEEEEIEPDFFKAVIKMLFDKKPNNNEQVDKTTRQKKLEEALSNLSPVLSENSHQGSTSRQAILYELNNQRSINTVVEDKENFDRLCSLFDAFLSGCARESIDISNAKMLMILSSTFYFVNHEDGEDASDRTTRFYVKDRIGSHDIWTDDYFWDQALYQCVEESLKKSGVLLNYVKPKEDDFSSGSQKRIKWHDLNPNEYTDAAAQVHSVVFAQLGTLSHSMLELGCGISRACNFVRRLSIRYQMPLSLRITLIQHLAKRVTEKKE